MTNQTFDIKKAFEDYKNVIFNVENDQRFWKSFLDLSIKNYEELDHKPEEIYSAIFTVFNIESKSNNGFLSIHNEIKSIKTLDLKHNRELFFSWILNLSILKAYNAVEILFLRTIWLKFYPTYSNPTTRKKNSEAIQKEIKNYLSKNGYKCETKNNRQLIMFLKAQKSELPDFLDKTIRIDLNTTWLNFFELISILRNIIAHQGTLVTEEIHNEIKSKSKDVFERHFDIEKDRNDEKHLRPKEKDFNDFLSLINDFAVNTVKFTMNENNLNFLNMK